MLRLLLAGGALRRREGMPRLRVLAPQCCCDASGALDDGPPDADARLAGQVMAGQDGLESRLSQESANVIGLVKTML